MTERYHKTLCDCTGLIDVQYIHDQYRINARFIRCCLCESNRSGTVIVNKVKNLLIVLWT